jgi:hypothetical protein
MGKKSNRGTKEEVQNRILIGFEKAIRQSGSKDETVTLSLAEQLKQLEADEDAAFMERIRARKANQDLDDDFTYIVSRP